MKKPISCAFNMDTACVELRFTDGSICSIDCTAVRYNRLMLVENGTQNYVNAEDCSAFLRLVYNRQCVSQEASEQMLAHLLAQQVNDRIPQGLPEGTQCAHKTGDLLGLCCADVGIVFTPQTDFLLCIICNDPADYQTAIRTCITLARTAAEKLCS